MLNRPLFIALALTAFALLMILHQDVDTPASAGPLAAGEVYVVNSTDDALDANPTDGICATAGGICTLRAAIMQANYSTGAQTVTLPAGTFTLTQVGSDDTALLGDLDITDETTIIGAGADQTIVDGNGEVIGDRVFHVLPAGFLRVSGLTVRNGRSATGLSKGGGLLCQDSYRGVVIDQVVFEGNSALNGGGIQIEGCVFTVTGSIVRQNAARFEMGAGSGGGISVIQTTSPLRAAVVRDTLIMSNAAGTAGGIFVESAQAARIEQSEIISNTASSGGGVANRTSFAGPVSRLSIIDTTIRENHAAYGGGAIENRDSLVLTRTTIVSNTADLFGGGLFATGLGSTSQIDIGDSTFTGNRAERGGALAFYLVGTTVSDLVLRNSTLSQNAATTDGGAIYAFDAIRLALVNSTVDGNQAGRDGGGIFASTGAKMWLNSVTLTENQVTQPPNQTGTIRGGGLYITSTAAITVQNVLIARNALVPGINPPIPSDCFVNPTTSLRLAPYNLIQNNSGCIFSGTTVGLITGQFPSLRPLANYGGWTPTRMPLYPNPIFNAGDPTGCKDHRGVLLATDQRGVTRADAGRCDLGAVEPIESPGLNAVSPLIVSARPAFTLTLTGTNFIPNSYLLWDGTPVPTTILDSSRLTVVVPSDLVTSTGVHTIAVQYGPTLSFIQRELTVTVTSVDQSITFGPLPPRSIGDAPFALSATASSGLPVTYQASGVCLVSGNTLTLTGVGTCTITATQPGDGIYTAAQPVTQSFAVAPGPITPPGSFHRIMLPIGHKG